MDYKYVLAHLLNTERKILQEYDYDKDKASKHVGYNEIANLAIEITKLIKEEEENVIVDDSFIL